MDFKLRLIRLQKLLKLDFMKSQKLIPTKSLQFRNRWNFVLANNCNEKVCVVQWGVILCCVCSAKLCVVCYVRCNMGIIVCCMHCAYYEVGVCVCHNEKKKVPDEWQARQALPAILQVSSSKHNAKKITTRVPARFISRSLPSLQRKKERREAVY